MTSLNKKENRENFSTMPKWQIGLIVAGSVLFMFFIFYISARDDGTGYNTPVGEWAKRITKKGR